MSGKRTLVAAVGITDCDCNVFTKDRRHIKSYTIWTQMIRRCYDTKRQVKQPTYIGCSVSPEWIYFSNFKQWFDANYVEGMHLDKDILVEGNKVYSANTCRFVPKYINSLLNKNNKIRGNLPIGVSLNTTKGQITPTYKAQCSYTILSNTKILTKTFKTIEEAVTWYSETKTRVVREVARHALDAGEIGQDVFDALTRRVF